MQQLATRVYRIGDRNEMLIELAARDRNEQLPLGRLELLIVKLGPEHRAGLLTAACRHTRIVPIPADDAQDAAEQATGSASPGSRMLARSRGRVDGSSDPFACAFTAGFPPRAALALPRRHRPLPPTLRCCSERVASDLKFRVAGACAPQRTHLDALARSRRR